MSGFLEDMETLCMNTITSTARGCAKPKAANKDPHPQITSLLCVCVSNFKLHVIEILARGSMTTLHVSSTALHGLKELPPGLLPKRRSRQVSCMSLQTMCAFNGLHIWAGNTHVSSRTLSTHLLILLLDLWSHIHIYIYIHISLARQEKGNMMQAGYYIQWEKPDMPHKTLFFKKRRGCPISHAVLERTHASLGT